MTDSTDLKNSVAALMPDVLQRLDALVRIPSIAFPGFAFGFPVPASGRTGASSSSSCADASDAQTSPRQATSSRNGRREPMWRLTYRNRLI